MRFLSMNQSYTKVCSSQTIKQLSLLVLTKGAIQLVPSGWGPVRVLSKGLATEAGTLSMFRANMVD